ncbi:TonB-dependent receptor plug domain-containing protein [Novosphingobium guangzhouense]|uniref:TonB-dependent receptor n=1 Tax=Novosphingobium guangzhouense TaxID=1850347 RepID=A0A2K2FWM9_9SPHN|nr:TonB-dependent receptor [Novosphingobium guangzhouense]PNU03168.1 TonB-dependent receptor [Novosphingobium guangzhouense]
MKTPPKKAALRSATCLTAFVMMCGVAHAQDTSATDTSDENTIVVTGSITRNPAAATASPVVSVTADDLTKRGITTVSDALQSLTANNAGTIPASWSANGFTTGATAPSLRGFNNAYTLTLFDGMRTAYYPLADDTQRNIVDINSIPSSSVQSIDTLLDGASATYGSDAIAGVVNVITKRQVQGLHLDASMGISQRGDGAEQRINATYGYGDLNEQGFNIYASAEYQHNDATYLRNRKGPWGTADQSSICGTAEQGCLNNSIRNGIQADGSYNGFQSTTVNFGQATQTTIDENGNYVPVYGSITDDEGNTRSALLYSGSYQLLNAAAGCGNLTAATLTPEQQAVGQNKYDGGPTVNNAPSVVCQQDLVHDYSMYTAETTRKGASLRGTVKVGDNAEAFIAFNYYNVKTANQNNNSSWAGQTAAGGDVVAVTNVFLPVYVCPTGTASVVGGNLLATGCNASNGTLNPNNPYAAQGQLARLSGMPDQPRRTFTDAKTYRVAAGINGSFGDGWDYSVGATASEVTLDVKNTGYIYLQGLADAIAQGTYNFVDPSANSEEARQQVFPDQNKRATSKLAQVVGTLSKDVFELPGGMVNVAVAGQYRYESIDNPSSNAPNNENPYARYYGINAVGVEGHRNIWSASYEIAVPIVDQFRVKFDGSYDHYSTGQKNFSPKFEAEFRPVDQLKLRGTFSKGFRAPNLNESFQLPATGYQNSQIVCSDELYAAFCAAHKSNPAYYAGTYSPGSTNSGNPDLKAEKSTSYTLGAVLQPTRNLTFTLDYWHTKIKNLITSVSIGDAIAQYYANDGVVNLPGVTVIPGQADPQNPDALPLLGQVVSSFKNDNAMLGSGIDFSADARVYLTDKLTLQSKANASYLIRLQQENSDGSVWRYDGSLGGCNLTSCSGAPRFRLTWQNTLDFNNKGSLTLTANYTSGYSSTSADAGGVYKDCQASGTAGQLLTYDNGDPVQCHAKATFDLDAHGEVKVAEQFRLYFDVLNVLDGKPKYDPNAGYGLYQFNPAWQDRLFMGRYLRVGAKVDF